MMGRAGVKMTKISLPNRKRTRKKQIREKPPRRLKRRNRRKKSHRRLKEKREWPLSYKSECVQCRNLRRKRESTMRNSNVFWTRRIDALLRKRQKEKDYEKR